MYSLESVFRGVISDTDGITQVYGELSFGSYLRIQQYTTHLLHAEFALDKFLLLRASLRF